MDDIYNQYPDYDAISAELAYEAYPEMQQIILQQAEAAGYAYELLNSLLNGTIKVSNAAGRTAIRKAMARLDYKRAD